MSFHDPGPPIASLPIHENWAYAVPDFTPLAGLGFWLNDDDEPDSFLTATDPNDERSITPQSSSGNDILVNNWIVGEGPGWELQMRFRCPASPGTGAYILFSFPDANWNFLRIDFLTQTSVLVQGCTGPPHGPYELDPDAGHEIEILYDGGTGPEYLIRLDGVGIIDDDQHFPELPFPVRLRMTGAAQNNLEAPFFGLLQIHDFA